MNQFRPLRFFETPLRKPGQRHVIGLRCEPLDTVRIAFIGLGMRMNATLKRFLYIDGVEIKAIADICPDKISHAKTLLEEHNRMHASVYTNNEDWKAVCERTDIDLIYISTHYDLHVPIAVYAMQCGKHAAIEVPAATTLEDCWKLIDTAENTRRHCIQLENCNYGDFELASLHMVQKGLLGEIVHAEGAYIHDLKKLIFDTKNGYWNMWRLRYHEKKNGNLYPTHGLGPVSHALNIHRGDAFDYLVSMSSAQFNLSAWAAENFGSESDFAQRAYKCGDMNTTLIRTHKGKTIKLQHDISSPRPYSRIFMLSGTKGFLQKWPQKTISFAPNGLNPLNEEEASRLISRHEHPIRTAYREKLLALGSKVCEIGKNEGMDYIMDSRLIYCLQKGLPLDQDVYDAAEWSSIIELSEKSVENFSVPVEIPDFTRGAWKDTHPLEYQI